MIINNYIIVFKRVGLELVIMQRLVIEKVHGNMISILIIDIDDICNFFFSESIRHVA